MKATGIIFTNIYDNFMGDLTRKRSVASLPFGGRYRLIDFMLSNLVNSGVFSVGVLTKYNYRSLLDHLGSGSEWDLDRKNGGLFILPPFTSGNFAEPRGKFEAMYNAIPFLNRVKSDYVILCDASVVCMIDFDKVLEEHISSGADVTAVANIEGDYYCDKKDVCFEVEDGKLIEISVGYRRKKNNPVSMGIYILERKKLIDAAEEFICKGRYSFEKDYLQTCFINNKIKINISMFDGIVFRTRNVESYFKNNLRLIEDNVRKEFFNRRSPVYTKVRYETPTLYSETSKVNDCFVADGCRISGMAENSVIFRDVVLEEGAKVKNCVIMQGVKISKNANIKNAIIEKNTFIGEGEVFCGADNSPVIVK